MSILDLQQTVQALPPVERRLFDRIFAVSVDVGRLRVPESMRPWLQRHLGDAQAAEEQRVMRVTNHVTGEETLFNPLRARRPLEQGGGASVEEALAGDDPLSEPFELTPEDDFGRIEGRYCLTTGNVAKAAGRHALVVFAEPHPLRFTREMLHDYVDTAQRWAEAVQGREPEAVYPLVLWNCLWRAGSSLPHGHAQVLVAKGRAFAGHESLRRAAEAYTRQHDAAYFDDLYRAHAALGCAFEREGVRVLAYLAPLKEREALILAPALSAALKDALYDVLACYRDRLGVQSFNLVLYQPPLAPTAESWDGFPRVVRVVDRGPLSERTCDIGAMELYGASVVASDPFELAGALAQALDARL